VNAADYSANFAYDSFGRATDVFKLQSTTGGTYSYVQTHTTYASNGTPCWGQAATVTEDYGSGHINRLTQTHAYTAWGKACDVIDAASHEFVTSYDLDGNVQSVTRTDNGLNQTIASYVYGTVPGSVSYGQVLSVTDGLSGVTDSMTYQGSGNGLGQVSGVAESGGPNPGYTVGYFYDPMGNRSQTTYTTPNGTWNWLYHDYVMVGAPEKLKMAFQTLTLLDSSGNPTAEEMQYSYDSTGRLLNACFAQTPASGYTPGTGGEWYPIADDASTRARAAYDYDPAGRVRSVYHWWETWNGTSYNDEAILGNTCEYEFSGLNRGLKTESDFYQNTAQGSSAWTLNHTETYSYDPSLDYLTGAAYGDGLANANPTWSYDAAGNRTDSVVDNLNRTTSIGGTSTSCDILGNRLSLGPSVSYGWDCLHRMTSYTSGSNGSSYAYRSDGMRVGKQVGSTGTAYSYDGQMGFEDVDTTGSRCTITDYGLGARGVDYIVANNQSQSTITYGYPIYDGHGNMVACLERAGTGYYSVSNQRSYDAWGATRQGSATGDPKGRYCSNLGHKQDDESGLLYMRSRYYDPISGRFLSEDPDRKGHNWTVYCSDNPINGADPSGRDDLSDLAIFLVGVMAMVMGAIMFGIGFTLDAQATAAAQYAASLAGQGSWVADLSNMSGGAFSENEVQLFMKMTAQDGLAGSLTETATMYKSAGAGLGLGGALFAIAGYNLLINAYLLDDDLASDGSSLDIVASVSLS
jgi:RHS repeat-associated protein